MKLVAALTLGVFLAAPVAAQTFSCDRAQWLADALATSSTAMENFESFAFDHSFEVPGGLPIAVGTLSTTGPSSNGWNYVDAYVFESFSIGTPPYFNNTQCAYGMIDFGQPPTTAASNIVIDLTNRARAFGAMFGDAFNGGEEHLEMALYDGANLVAVGTRVSTCSSTPTPNYVFFGAASPTVPFDRVVLRSLSQLTGRSETFSMDELEVIDALCLIPNAAYCTAGTTSHGCVPAIGAAGQPSASNSGTFILSLTAAEGQRNGYLFYGVSGSQAGAWGMGGTSTLCVTSPTQRLPAHNTGGNLATCDGTFSDDWNSYVANSPSALGCPFLGGEQVWVQAWVRDPGAVKNSNLSAALTFQLCP